MKYLTMTALALFMVAAGCSQPEPDSSNSKDEQIPAKQSIEKLLKSYETALNNSDTESVMKLYAEDGVFMPSEAPTSIGQEQVRGAYDFVFSQIKLNIKFITDEIEIAGDVAFARTISRGTTDVLAAGINVPEENRELFIFKKVNGEWKIARYIFNKMSPQK